MANLAQVYLTKEHYLSHIVDIRFNDSDVMHSICVFQELDGTWSYFQASEWDVGYVKVNARNIDELIKEQFRNIKEYKIVT